MNQTPSGLEPPVELLLNRAGLRPEVLTTWPHTDLHLKGDFIWTCFGSTVKTKEIQFLSFSRKIRPFGKKFLYHQMPHMMIHNHAKFAPLDFINKKMIGKRRFFYPNRTSPSSGASVYQAL